MSKLLSSVLKPFAKLTGAMPSAQQIPEGYEAVKTGTKTSYQTGGGRDDQVTTISQEQYDKLVTAADARPDFSSYGDFGQGQGGSGGASIASQYRRREQDVYEILPINRNQTTAPTTPPTTPATTPPTTPPTTPATTPATVAPDVTATSPAPPSGGVQPTQPAQPDTSATATVPKIKPAAVVSASGVPGAQAGAAPRRRGGRRAFVQTSSVGLTAPAQTTKKTLLGA